MLFFVMSRCILGTEGINSKSTLSLRNILTWKEDGLECDLAYCLTRKIFETTQQVSHVNKSCPEIGAFLKGYTDLAIILTLMLSKC